MKNWERWASDNDQDRSEERNTETDTQQGTNTITVENWEHSDDEQRASDNDQDSRVQTRLENIQWRIENDEQRASDNDQDRSEESNTEIDTQQGTVEKHAKNGRQLSRTFGAHEKVQVYQ